MKTKTLYEIREFTGNEYSRPLSAKLRDRSRALRLVRALKGRGRDVFAAPVKVAA